MSPYTLEMAADDRPLARKESGERMALAIALGYLASLAFLTAILIVGSRYHELPVAVVLLLLSLPSAIGGVVAGWIAYVRPLRAAVFMLLLYGLIAPALTNGLELRTLPGQSFFSALWEYQDVIAFLGLLAALMLLFAITSASLAGYLRRRRVDYPAFLA